MSFTNDLETSMLRYFFELTADASLTISQPAGLYLGLFTDTTLTDADTPTEVSGNNYSRKAVTMTVSGNVASNSGAVEFDAATGDWGTVYYAGVFDASTAGNLLAYAALTTAKTVGTGDVIRVPIGDLDITLD